MENLVVVSKLKKFVKDTYGLSVATNFFEPLNKEIALSINVAIEHARKNKRKTVMGRDFNFYVHEPNVDTNLVVASKLKSLIKDKADMSCSKQCPEQLTVRVKKIMEISSQKTIAAKRKTIMDKDFQAPIET